MAVVTVTSTEWSAPVELTSAELWQAQAGRLVVTTEATPSGPMDGVVFNGETQDTFEFKAGQTLRYRSYNAHVPCVLVRLAVL